MTLVMTRTAIVVTDVLPEGELLFFALMGHETLGRPFEYRVELLSENPNIGLSQLVGHPITIALELPDQPPREYSGMVTQFSFTGAVGRYAAYQAVIRPWLWLLSQTVRSRIFPPTSVPDVIEKLFREHGFSDFSSTLSPGAYRTFEYLVQYRESDLNFISRIMELEGIYYFFKHHDGKHTLVLADSYSAHDPAPGYESIPYFPPQPGERRERDHIDRWQVRRGIRPGKFFARDFNFTRPGGEPIEKNLAAPLDQVGNEYEVYDYPGKFQDSAEADAQARVRLEEQQADLETVQGEGNARGLGCGGLFALTQFPRDDQNKQYLIVHAEYEIKVTDYESVEKLDQHPDFRLRFVAMDSSQPYRAPRITRKPVIEGPQTAIVVGQAGQEIWTDQYGRVRLQFHWDREGQSDQKSSCWVRVSQAWAGSQWGAIHIPRIGQEVIVDFLEGDPDRPIVTGRVYNADNMPPYKLPDNQTQSGIKSRSSKGGTPSNFNEIRFEDLKGKEDLYVHAERSQTTVVKGSQSISVGGERSVSVTGKDTESYKDKREITVGSTDVLTITGKHSGYYNNEREVIVGTLDKTSVDGEKNTGVKGTYNITATDEYMVIQGGNMIDLVGGSVAVFTNDKCRVLLDGGEALFGAADKLELHSGGSTITLTSGGDITISGTKIVLDADTIELTGATSVKTSGGGSKVELTSASAKVQGQAVEISGASQVKINS